MSYNNKTVMIEREKLLKTEIGIPSKLNGV